MNVFIPIIGAACTMLLLGCSTPKNLGVTGDPLLREIDNGLNLLLFADLSLQNIGRFMENARLTALKLSYDKEARVVNACPVMYSELLNGAVAAIGESRYKDVPLIDQSSIDWPGYVKVRVSADGGSMSLTLPAVNPDSWGLLSLRDDCAGVHDTIDSGKELPYGDHVKMIDTILDKIAAERRKVKEQYVRLASRRKTAVTVQVWQSGQPADALKIQ